jgi:hypothetical protein
MDDLKKLIDEYRNEVYTATSAYFAWKALNNLPVADHGIYVGLNDNAGSWLLIRHSLQVTFLIVAGRIFDRDARSLTIFTFLARCKLLIRQFSKQSLEARRIQDANGTRPEYLDAYLGDPDRYEPTVADFEMLEQRALDAANTYEQKYAPVRNKLIAHRDMAVLANTGPLWEGTNIGEFDRLLLFVYQVERVIDQFYLNCRLTKLEEYSLTQRETALVADLQDLLQKVARR